MAKSELVCVRHVLQAIHCVDMQNLVETDGNDFLSKYDTVSYRVGLGLNHGESLHLFQGLQEFRFRGKSRFFPRAKLFGRQCRHNLKVETSSTNDALDTLDTVDTLDRR
jgi:hypothetical protein